jgi:transcriptional regulator with XRE-family HTH domain
MTRDSGVGIPADRRFGDRVQIARTRRGLSREATAALCGRSEEWLRQIERGRRGTSLKMVSRLAEVLHVQDLTELLGDEAPTAVYARPEHPALGRVRRALSSYGAAADDAVAPALDEVRQRVRQAWRLRAVSGRDRTDLAAVLPDLLVDAQRATRTAAPGADRRSALAVLADVYHLGQLYLCYQDAPELLWVVVDRAMSAAQESEDPAAIGRAAWFSAYLYRDFGVVDQAHQVVEDAARHLGAAEPTPALLRQRSVVHLASAWNHAREGQPALAWRAWDAAVDADRGAADMPAAWVLFGTDVADVALTLDVELGKIASASRRAEAIDPTAIESVPRRTRLMIEASRGQMLKREYAGAVHLLRRAQQTSPEATLFSAHARSMVHELQAHAGPLLRPEIAELADGLGIGA